MRLCFISTLSIINLMTSLFVNKKIIKERLALFKLQIFCAVCKIIILLLVAQLKLYELKKKAKII